jgi:hypothetical protein
MRYCRAPNMSKKKKAAKLAAKRSRKELIARRIDDAAATFQEGFPSPYATPEEEAADRQLCEELRQKAVAEAADDELAGELFIELGDETFAYRPWAIAFRDQLAQRYGSHEEADERARFHLAHVWLADRREGMDPELARVARVLFGALPFEAPAPAAEGDAPENP